MTNVIALGKTYTLLSTTSHFECISLSLFFSLWYWEVIFNRHMVESSVFQLISYTSPTPLLNQQYTPITHTTHSHTQHMPHTLTSVQPNQPYHIIHNEPVTIPPRANTIMTIPSALPHSADYLFEPARQHFVKQPVHYTPIIINAANYNVPVHFINHNDQEVVIP